MTWLAGSLEGNLPLDKVLTIISGSYYILKIHYVPGSRSTVIQINKDRIYSFYQGTRPSLEEFSSYME